MIWSAHGECGALQFNLNDGAGNITEICHLPILFLESDCVLCEPCVGVQTVLLWDPSSIFACFADGAICKRHVSVG